MLIFVPEFDPEPCPKWDILNNLLTQEIPEEVKQKKDGSLKNTKILILCQDTKTCSQLNHYLTMGAHKYLFYNAFRKELTVNKVSKKYTSLTNTVTNETEANKEKGKKTKKDKVGTSKEDESEKTNELDNDEDECFNLDDANKSNYVLTLTQVSKQSKSTKNLHEESIFEPISQVRFSKTYDIITINFILAAVFKCLILFF